MRLRQVDWLFIVGALGVVVGVSLLPTPKDRNPLIPRTPEHEAVRTEKDCVACHAVQAVRPLPARHPKRPDCFRCHARSPSDDGRKTSLVNGQWGKPMVNSESSRQIHVQLTALRGPVTDQ